MAFLHLMDAEVQIQTPKKQTKLQAVMKHMQFFGIRKHNDFKNKYENQSLGSIFGIRNCYQGSKKKDQGQNHFAINILY